MEYIYIVQNSSFPQMVKIGRTKHIDKRLNELNQIVPTPWELIKSYEVTSSSFVEKIIHDSLKDIRIRTDREFFKTTESDIVIKVDELVSAADKLYLDQKFKSIIEINCLEDISKIIKETRLAKNISQLELSRLSDVSLPTIVRIESGKSDPSIGTLLKLTTILGCHIKFALLTDREIYRSRVKKSKNVS